MVKKKDSSKSIKKSSKVKKFKAGNLGVRRPKKFSFKGKKGTDAFFGEEKVRTVEDDFNKLEEDFDSGSFF